MRIALRIQGGTGWAGGLQYIKTLAAALSSRPQNGKERVRVTLLTDQLLKPSDEADFRKSVDEVLVVPASSTEDSIVKRLKWRFRKKAFGEIDSRLEELISQRGFDFVYPHFPGTTRARNSNYAPWIADFQHKHLPEFFSPDELRQRDWIFEKMARVAPQVILSSFSAENDFRRFYPFAAHKSRVLTFCTPCSEDWYRDDPVKVQKHYNLPDKFCLVANQLWRHKNHLLVLKAMKDLRDNGTPTAVVFTGPLYDYRFPEHSSTFFQSIHQLGLQREVYVLGMVPRGDYIQLLRRCIAIIQPSLFEGWSTIVEDARSLGKAAILSDLDVHREQMAGGSTFFERTSAEDLASKLREAWETLAPGPDLRTEDNARAASVDRLQLMGRRFLEIGGFAP